MKKWNEWNGSDGYDLLNMADKLIASIEKYYPTSALPERPDEVKAIATLIEIREELYNNSKI